MPKIKLTKNFRLAELACRCGCYGHLTPEILANLISLAEMLEKLREACGGKPITLNCGYRCPRHNAEVGGASQGLHLTGRAADITVAGLTPQRVQEIAAQIREIGGLGIYATFTHVDIRPHLAGRQESWRG